MSLRHQHCLGDEQQLCKGTVDGLGGLLDALLAKVLGDKLPKVRQQPSTTNNL